MKSKRLNPYSQLSASFAKFPSLIAATLVLGGTLPMASAATLSWDGGTASIGGDGNGASGGGAGVWDLATANWDAGASPHVVWTQGSDAIFGGTPGVVTLAAGISAATITIDTGVYSITAPVGFGLTVTGGVTSTTGLSSVNGAGGLTLSGAQTFNVTGGLAVTAPLTGSDTLTKSGPGMMGLSGANGAFTGKFLVKEGRFGVSGDAALGGVPVAFVADSITLNGGTLVGGTPNNADGLRFNNAAAFIMNANRGVYLGEAGGTFQAGYAADGRVTIPGSISGPGSLSKTDSGSFALTGSNTYSGGTTIVGGAISVGEITTGNGLLGKNDSLGTGPVVVAAGAQLLLASSGLDIPNDITLNGLGTVQGRVGALVGGFQAGVVTGKVSGTLTLASDGPNSISTWWSNKTLTLAGKVTGIGGIQINNISSAASTNQGGVIVLSNPLNDYRGVTSVSNNGPSTSTAMPTLRLGASNVIPDGPDSSVVIVNGLLDLAGFDETINGLFGTGRFTTGLGKFRVGSNNEDSAFSGTFGASTGAGLVKIGTGTLTISGTADNGNGRARVEEGTLLIAKTSSSSVHALGSGGNTDYALIITGGIAKLDGTGSDQIYANAAVSITGGAFDMNGRNEGFDGLAGTGGIVTNTGEAASIVTLGQNKSAGLPDFGGVIENGTGIIGITKTGTGTQTLSGNNTYTGPTSIEVGTLLVNGSLASGSAVTVADSAILGGHGVVHGTVTTTGTAIIAPGGTGTIGTLGLGSSSLTGVLRLDHDASSTDRLNVTGNLDITDSFLQLLGDVPPAAAKITLVKYSGTLTGTFSAEVLPDGYSLTYDSAAKEIYISRETTGSFSTYMAAFANLSSAQRLPGADPDGDGLSNLLEYALDGFDPVTPDVTVASIQDGLLSFTKRALALQNGDVTYSIEQSPTLGADPSPWAVVTPETNDASVISYRLPVGQASAFARLKVIQN